MKSALLTLKNPGCKIKLQNVNNVNIVNYPSKQPSKSMHFIKEVLYASHIRKEKNTAI